MPVVKMNKIVKIYNKGKKNAFEALHGVSLEIEKGEMVAVMGTSGAGKSTLLHIMGCIDNYDSGEYILDGELIKNLGDSKLSHIRNEKVGIVMQDFALVESMSSIDNVLIPLDFARKKLPSKKRKEKAVKALKLTGMEEYARKRVSQLSGGQKQRIAIARAIANDPAIILADEPTGALDSRTTGGIMDVFSKLNEDGKTVIIITHDPKVGERCHRVIRVEDGMICDRKDPASLSGLKN